MALRRRNWANGARAGTALLLVAAALAMGLAGAGCAKPAPPDLVVAPSGAAEAPAPQPPPSTPSPGSVSAGRRLAFSAYYYRHNDGDKAVYRVIGNVHKLRKMTVTYRRRVILMLDQQRASVLEVRRDFGDRQARSVFYLEDETSGTTHALGALAQGDVRITMYDPPPVTLYWARAAQKGSRLEIPYRPTVAVGEQRVSVGDMRLDTLTVLGTESIGVRDATGTPVRYRRALKWKLDEGAEGVTTIWWGRIGEAVREDYANGTFRERRELVRVIRR